jgi:hypothetical protein
MKIEPLAQEACLVTLQTVLDRLSRHRGLTPSRQRDLRSAVTSFAKLNDQPPAAIPLDLGAIRHSLDKIVPARAKISLKRWSNLRTPLRPRGSSPCSGPPVSSSSPPGAS